METKKTHYTQDQKEAVVDLAKRGYRPQAIEDMTGVCRKSVYRFLDAAGVERPRHKKHKMKVYCTQCGAELVPGAKFCHECGHRVLSAKERAFKDLDTAIRELVKFAPRGYCDAAIGALNALKKEVK